MKDDELKNQVLESSTLALTHRLPEDAFDGTAFLIAFTNALRKQLSLGLKP